MRSEATVLWTPGAMPGVQNSCKEALACKVLIFDLDGVICFTDEYHYLAWKEMADGMGIYFDREINNRLRGVSRMESLEIILERYEGPELTDTEKQALAERKK